MCNCQTFPMTDQMYEIYEILTIYLPTFAIKIKHSNRCKYTSPVDPSWFCYLVRKIQDLRQLERERQREREADRLERLRLEKALEEIQGHDNL